MTVLADFLKDTSGKTWIVYPDGEGGMAVSDESTVSQESESWTDPSYTIPTTFAPVYRTLADGDGNTWYMYIGIAGSIVISDTVPTAVAGIWMDPNYGLATQEATTGDEIYMAYQDINETDWYVYPDGEGGYTITTTQPS